VILPVALIDTLEYIDETQTPSPSIVHPCDFTAVINFLKIYDGNNATFESYRRELERLLQWTWLIVNKSVFELTREDIEAFIQFCLNPPKQWISQKRAPRFIDQNGDRIPNVQWRPFVVKVSKSAHKKAQVANVNDYQMSQSSIRALFAVLGSFYDYLLLEEKITRNPVAMIRQKSRYLQKAQNKKQIIRLSDTQWQACLTAVEKMACLNPAHERTLFIITAMYLMYMRISEFAASDRWIPSMNHFYRDSNNQWWFKTLGKGNKLREIAVSDAMLKALGRYRQSLGYSALPSPADNIPLIQKTKGKGAIESTRQIRRLIQDCFNHAIISLREKNLAHEADSLESATVHWLRHTGISDDVNKRGRSIMHVRDDAGHASIVTTEGYSDVELKDRYQSAKHKNTYINTDE